MKKLSRCGRFSSIGRLVLIALYMQNLGASSQDSFKRSLFVSIQKLSSCRVCLGLLMLFVFVEIWLEDDVSLCSFDL